MTKVLVVATSRKTRGGITAVLKLYEQSEMWQRYHCYWIGTHRDGNKLRKIWYSVSAMIQFVAMLPFYDVVHIHFSLTRSARRKYPFFKLAMLFGKKVVIHLHCGSQIDDIWSPVYQDMFEKCDCGIVLSESLKATVEKHIGASDKIMVVYNPCPIITSTAQYSKKNHVLFAGTLYEGKGYKDLIKAFAIVADKYPDWKAVFAGNGEMEKASALAKDLGIESQIDLLGWLNGNKKHRAFCEAKILCLPSYAEGFPMAVLDAWAYGLPVVTTPVGGVPDVAVDGNNMLLFNPGDVESLAEKLDLLMGDAALRGKLSVESLKLSKGRFSLNTITEQLTKLYDCII